MPLVLLTSMGVRTDNPEFAAAGFACCLTKPIKPAQLYEVLVRVISGTKPTVKKPPADKKVDRTLATRLPLRILLCDDNAINQKVALRLLQQFGYNAELAGNGLEALVAFEKHTFDLIFMDIMMPEMGGIEAAAEIRARQRQRSQYPNYKSPMIIVAMTANAMQGDREKCLAAGMDDYLAKPVRPEDIRAILERWGERASHENVDLELKPSRTDAAAGAADNAAHNGTAGEPPVDLDRLLDFTDGNADNLRELITLYIDQTSGQIKQLETAVEGSVAAEVRRLAHSCAGASATCGMRRMVPLLRELERQGHEGNLVGAAQVCSQLGDEFRLVRTYLENYLAGQTAQLSQT